MKIIIFCAVCLAACLGAFVCCWGVERRYRSRARKYLENSPEDMALVNLLSEFQTHGVMAVDMYNGVSRQLADDCQLIALRTAGAQILLLDGFVAELGGKWKYHTALSSGYCARDFCVAITKTMTCSNRDVYGGLHIGPTVSKGKFTLRIVNLGSLRACPELKKGNEDSRSNTCALSILGSVISTVLISRNMIERFGSPEPCVVDEVTGFAELTVYGRSRADLTLICEYINRLCQAL